MTDQSGPRPLSANQMREALKNFSSLDEGGREGMRRSMTPEQFAFVSSRQGRNASLRSISLQELSNLINYSQPP